MLNIWKIGLIMTLILNSQQEKCRAVHSLVCIILTRLMNIKTPDENNNDALALWNLLSGKQFRSTLGGRQQTFWLMMHMHFRL